MSFRRLLALSTVLAVLALSGAAQPPAAQEDLNDSHEKVMKEAVQKVAPSVVQILTQGGADMVVTGPKGVVFRKGLGPTTGVIVSPDGYVISSAFNFINNPTTILVGVAGHKEPFIAKRIATDKSRFLTLLHMTDSDGKPVKGLPVPAFVPQKELQVGQWSLALGRTLDLKRTGPPSVSSGVISALGRVWGKAIQTDAKVSPVNYGGPLIDVQGRVQGILIPASPRGEEETAGFEWYDSGIGFAVPMEHVVKLLPRLKEGKDLKKGLLGIRVKSQDMYGAVPEIGEVTANSAAARAGLKPGDVILEIDGHPVVRQAQVLHQLGPKYEGDKISLKYKRADKVVAVNDLALAGELAIYTHPFLGILPLRDDPKLGVEVRYVYPRSPADVAGIKAGDRIVKVSTNEKPPVPFQGAKRGRDELFDILNKLAPGTDIKLEVLREGGKKTDTVSVKLADMPGSTRAKDDTVPEKLPKVASAKKALEALEKGPPPDKGPKVKGPKVEPPKKDKKDDKVDPPKKEEKADPPKTGFIKRTNAAGHKYWIWVPTEYDPNISYSLVVWLHPPGKNKDEDGEKLADAWEDYCADNHIILVGPQTDAESGWIPSDSDFVLETMRDVMGRYTIDRQRVVAHGMGVGGQMAVYLGFSSRDLIRGVATTGAVVTQAKDNVATQRLAFYLAAGDRDPLAKAVADCRFKLIDHQLPVVYRELANRGREYLDERTLGELVRWIDALDRQ